MLYTQRKSLWMQTWQWNVFLTTFQYVCGTVFHDIPIDERNRGTLILELLYCKENLSCTSPIEIPYYSSKIFPKICYHCGSSKRLLCSDPVFYPQCNRCQSKEQQRIAKWKQVVNSDLGKSKKQKNFFTKYFLLLVSQGRMKEKLMSLKLLFDISFLISKTVFFQNHWVFLISNMRWQAVFIIRKWAWGPRS